MPQALLSSSSTSSVRRAPAIRLVAPRRRLVRLAPLAALVVAACGGAQPAAMPGGGMMPPTPVQIAPLRQGAIEDAERVRGHAQVAALDAHPAAGGGADHAHHGEVGRPRVGRRAARRDRPAAPAGGGVEPAGAARGARGGRRAGPRRQRAGARSSSRPAPSAAGGRTGRRPRSRRPRRTSARRRRRSRSNQVQLRYYTVTAPTTGIVGDVPVRVGDQVTTSDGAHDASTRTTARGPRAGADRARGRAEAGLPLRVLGADGGRRGGDDGQLRLARAWTTRRSPCSSRAS